MANHPFPQTRWTLIVSAQNTDADASSKAWEELALAYWKPVYAYLRGQGHPHEQAQDETQSFFAHMLDRDTLRNVQPEGARFRSFLLVCLNHRLIDAHRRKINVKQRAEISIEPWHEMEAINGNGLLYPAAASPEEAFDRSWAEELIGRAMMRLANRWEKRADLFAEIRFSVESPGDGAKYADIASRLGMTAGAVGKAAHDLRRQFGEEVRNEIRNTVAGDDDVDEELRYLASLWGGVNK
ncbi:MAG: RNA polymerase sigma factor (sigma-70 family) [Verrucomicrobiales bacterium]|jgi:RNA polymerase sigma factor (sigma-70 family)